MLANEPILGVLLAALRKKRRSHLSHRKGLTENLATKDSKNPLVLDRWMRVLLHQGQWIATLRTFHGKKKKGEQRSRPSPGPSISRRVSSPLLSFDTYIREKEDFCQSSERCRHEAGIPYWKSRWVYNGCRAVSKSTCCATSDLSDGGESHTMRVRGGRRRPVYRRCCAGDF